MGLVEKFVKIVVNQRIYFIPENHAILTENVQDQDHINLMHASEIVISGSYMIKNRGGYYGAPDQNTKIYKHVV